MLIPVNGTQHISSARERNPYIQMWHGSWTGCLGHSGNLRPERVDYVQSVFYHFDKTPKMLSLFWLIASEVSARGLVLPHWVCGSTVCLVAEMCIKGRWACQGAQEVREKQKGQVPYIPPLQVPWREMNLPYISSKMNLSVL